MNNTENTEKYQDYIMQVVVVSGGQDYKFSYNTGTQHRSETIGGYSIQIIDWWNDF